MKRTLLLMPFACLTACSFLTACGSAGLTAEEELERIADAEIGDFVIYGEYEQDNDIENGKEDIEWLVLTKNSNAALLVSRYCLDYKAHYTNTTASENMYFDWSDSLIRTWLNSLFINNAFSDEEQNYIRTTSITDADCGNTRDKLFLLSSGEIQQYFLTANERRASATPYASSLGATGSWWTRSKPSSGSDITLRLRFACVSNSGALNSNGYDCWGGYEDMGIRPAMWITLEN